MKLHLATSHNYFCWDLLFQSSPRSSLSLFGQTYTYRADTGAKFKSMPKVGGLPNVHPERERLWERETTGHHWPHQPLYPQLNLSRDLTFVWLVQTYFLLLPYCCHCRLPMAKFCFKNKEEKKKKKKGKYQHSSVIFWFPLWFWAVWLQDLNVNFNEKLGLCQQEVLYDAFFPYWLNRRNEQ